MAISEREITTLVQSAEEEFTGEDFVPQPYRWTHEQFNEIGDMGLFEGRRAILVEGEILAMPATNKPHRTALVLADAAFGAAFGPEYFMSMQSPFKVGQATDPEPDLAVISGSVLDYADQDLTVAEIIVEISDTTYLYDRREKASLYAKAGIQDYWIVRLRTRQVEVYRQPQPDDTQPFGFGYGERRVYESNAIVRPLGSANPIAISLLFPPQNQ